MIRENKGIRTRFAPSPTGELHIGGARTALFAYLFAKHSGGEFLLRIEDTDRERFVKGSVDRIFKSLEWLKIIADNALKPVIQSERLEIYKKHAQKLVETEKAYICTCSKEELERERQGQVKKGLPPRYSGCCRKIKNQKSKIKNIEEPYVIRMKMPESGKIVVLDLIRGKVEFDAGLMDDQIILKSDGYPTYHLASVVDDHEMGISHVIRSEEWLPSTPKHLVLYEAFGWEPPKFAHLSMILGIDKSKLSKRHGATSAQDYQKEGYLPEALNNFMALLGWNPKSEREFFTLSELIQEFSLENVNPSAAIFDIEKLNFFNEHYLRDKIKSQKSKVKNIVQEFGIRNITDEEIELIGRGGYKTLKEAAEYIRKLREEPEYEAELLIFKKSDKGRTIKGLKGVIRIIKDDEGPSTISGQGGLRGSFDSAQDRWKAEGLQAMMEGAVKAEELGNGDVFWPVRVALSGEEKSPSPVELLVVLGKEESLKRIEKAVEKLQNF